MVKALVITEMIDFNKKLTNELRENKLNIVVDAIASSKEEASEVLDEFSPDIVFIDKKDMQPYNIDILRKYSDVTIPLTYRPTRHLIRSNDLDLINDIIKMHDIQTVKLSIVKELEYIGYQFKYKGTHYLADSILETYLQQYVRHDTMTDNLQTNVYPFIAKKYNKTIFNIKSSIGKATDCMYCDCNMERLNDYFQFNYDFKPTPKQVMFTVINKILRSN
ncbi:MAG: hypothetical protein HFJ24_00550 [Clostridia bacterium]|nr:hypothetical protein [Clostridia bacterium]MCI9274579.1 hypothetical protein [Clostridia bacterium]